MGGSRGGITGVEDSQETMLPETYNRDPVATQRVQLATTSGHLMLTFPDDDSPSQLSSVAGTPREQYVQNRSMRLMGGSRGGITGVEDSQLPSVAGTPREQYHVQNSWEADHDYSDSAVHVLSVAGTPHDFSSEPTSNGSAASNDVEGPSHTRPPLGNITNNSIIQEWDGCSPDAVVKRLKALNKDQLRSRV
jgi:hypothetical protein